MTTAYLDPDTDTWYALYDSTKMGNGSGTRLQVGYAVDTGGHTWQNRVGIGFIDTIPSGATITSVTMRLKVRGTSGCFSKGSDPRFYIERLTDPNDFITENGTTGECAMGTGGSVDDQRWEGPPSTATGRISWAGNPAIGDVIEIDVTSLYSAWRAAKNPAHTMFGVIIKAQNETTQNQKIAFSSLNVSGPIHAGGNGPDIVVVYSTSVAPSTPTAALTPSSTRQLGTATREFTGNYTHPNGVALDAVQIIVATNSTLDGNGMLTTGVVHNHTDTVWTMPSPGNIWSTTRTFTQTRGTTYYWVSRVRDVNGLVSGWSARKQYPVNRLPVPGITTGSTPP